MKAEQIIVSLEGMDREKALLVAWSLSTKVWGFKINDLIISNGLDIVRDLKCLGRIFVDLKLFGPTKFITNTLCKLPDVDMVSIHAMVGRNSLRAAIQSTNSLIIADVDGNEETCCKSKDEIVWDLAHLSYQVGVSGIVCPIPQVKLLRHLNFMKIIHGIGEAANFYVVGEEITQAVDPIEALKKITS